MTIQIKADFRNRGFALFVNGEAIGAVYAQYKLAAIDREWLLAEMAP